MGEEMKVYVEQYDYKTWYNDERDKNRDLKKTVEEMEEQIGEMENTITEKNRQVIEMEEKINRQAMLIERLRGEVDAYQYCITYFGSGAGVE